MVELGLKLGRLIPKPVRSTLERGREETVPYPGVSCPPGTVKPKERNRRIKLAVSSNT